MVFSISLLSRNEEDVGKAIMKSGIPRDQIFVTTKVSTSSVSLVHNVFSEGSSHGKENTREALNQSLKRWRYPEFL